MIRSAPRIVVVQGEGADPAVRALERGAESVEEIASASTAACALWVNFGAEHTLFAAGEGGGFGVSVGDDAIVSAQNHAERRSVLRGFVCRLCGGFPAVLGGGRDRVMGARGVALLAGSGFKEAAPLEAGFPVVRNVGEMRPRWP